MGAPRPGLRAQRVMLYSLTGHVLSSLRAYWDLHRRPAADRPSAVTVPTAFAPYPADKWSPPKSLFYPREYKNVVRYAEPPRGGTSLRWKLRSLEFRTESLDVRKESQGSGLTSQTGADSYRPREEAGEERAQRGRGWGTVEGSCRRLQFVSPLRAARCAIEGQGTGDAKRVLAGVG